MLKCHYINALPKHYSALLGKLSASDMHFDDLTSLLNLDGVALVLIERST